MKTEPIQVVAAVRIEWHTSTLNRYWVCRRTDDGEHDGLAGMWEYPGGKVEQGETLEQALSREMREEFGVTIRILRFIDAIETSLNGKVYRVHFFEVQFLGIPELRVHDQDEWLNVFNLEEQTHLPSGTEFNRRIRAYTTLPV